MMTELDTLWTAYLHLQIRSGRRLRMDAMGWGMDAGLNHILAEQSDDSSVAAAVERGASREAYQARLRFKFFDSHQVDDPTAKLDDLDRLYRLLASFGGTDRVILLATGFGHHSTAVANLVDMKPDAVRKRIARLRARAASAC